MCTRLHIRQNVWWMKTLRVLFTFALMTVAWVFFRAASLADAFQILGRIVSAAGACFPVQLDMLGLDRVRLCVLLGFLAVFLTAEALEEPLQLRRLLMDTVWLRYALWVAMLLAIAVFGAYGDGYSAQEFVYFQF